MRNDVVEIVPSHILWRDALYYWTMRNLTIDEETKKDLERRGLPAKVAYEYGIRTFDKKKLEEGFIEGLKTLVRNKGLYFSELDKKEKVSIPGFYKENGEILCADCAKDGGAYMIPIINRIGLISGYQIRHLTGNTRYTYFSSANMGENGCGFSGCENIHYAGFKVLKDVKTPKAVNLTEGCLKADVAHYLSGKPYIAIMGVTNVYQLETELKMLKDRGTKIINLCFDMDYRTKKGVKIALEKVERIIEKCGLVYHQINWDENYKGIDDYLLSLKEKKQ